MGLFSFLSGKAGVAESADAPPVPATVATQPANPDAAHDATPTSGAASDSPFVPPSAWDTDLSDLNTGALTAPLPSVPSGQPQVGPADPALTAELQGPIIEVIKTVFDPEIPVDIYELGLIYRVDIDDNRNVDIDMTLTAPGCPVAGEMPGWVENAVSLVPGVGNVTVTMVFDPPWNRSMMSDAARLETGMF